MSKVYIISYDLNKPGQDYQDLYKRLKDYSSWWHYLDSTWLVYTSSSPDEIYKNLKPTLDKNDYILIIEVKKNYQGFLPEKAWNWINKYIPDRVNFY